MPATLKNTAILFANKSIRCDDYLPTTTKVPSIIASLLAVQRFYRIANALSIARGYNPNEPPHSRKVTETV